MEKLKLEVDELEVTSFEPARDEKAEGETVHGNTTVDACYPTIVRPLTCDC